MSENTIISMFGFLLALIGWLIYAFVKHVMHDRDNEVKFGTKIGRIMQKIGMND